MPRRPKDQYGSPFLKDGTASLERIVGTSSSRASQIIKKVTTEHYPRPVGSFKVPPHEQDLEFDLMKDDPAMLAQLAAQREWSLETFVDYLEKMEKRGAV